MKSPKNLNLAILEIESLDIFSWSPGTVEENIPCTEVHVMITIKNARTPLVMRMKSRDVVNSLIAALETHRDDVWPKV